MSPARRHSLRCLQQRHQVPRFVGHGTQSRGRLLATGHYVAAPRWPCGPQLLRGLDADRDQSYFLFATTRDQLAHLWFPLGGLRKPESARSLAASPSGGGKARSARTSASCRRAATPTCRAAEARRRRAGHIVHIDGRELGRHEGIIHYTVGQRRGLKIAGGEPLFSCDSMPTATRWLLDHVTSCAPRGLSLELSTGLVTNNPFRACRLAAPSLSGCARPSRHVQPTIRQRRWHGCRGTRGR